MRSNRSRVQELATKIQRATAPEAFDMKEMIGLLLEDAKNNLVKATGDDMLRVQGEAQALARLHEKITQSSPIAQE